MGGVGRERAWVQRVATADAPRALPSLLSPPPTHPTHTRQGVCVAVYGSDDFPAFFTRTSGCAAPARVDTPAQAAALIAASSRLGLGGGLLLAVPIPKEHAAAGGEVVLSIIPNCR